MPEATIKKYLTVQTKGSRQISRNLNHYNLQMIIAVEFKVNNQRAAQFRKWAGQVVKNHTIQGRTMDKGRLKNGHMFMDEYFDCQLQYIREIRLSERKFYQKITDLYATAFDYDKDARRTRLFSKLSRTKCTLMFTGIQRRNSLGAGHGSNKGRCGRIRQTNVAILRKSSCWGKPLENEVRWFYADIG